MEDFKCRFRRAWGGLLLGGLLGGLLSQGTAGPGWAATWHEDFASDPAARGWRLHGDASLFAWDPTNQMLAVTWDSARSNSFFFRGLPGGWVLNTNDDFSLAFELRLADIAAGVRPGKPGPFQIAVGFIHTANATNPGLVRGLLRCTNLLEFDYFPRGEIPGWGIIEPTVSPIIVASNRQAATSMTFPLELRPGDWFRVELRFTASHRTLVTSLSRNGQPFGPVSNVVLSASFADFRLDAVSVTSYADAGDPYGSVLAHGHLDNLTVTVPDPPRLEGRFANGLWQVEFHGRPGWLYALERSSGLNQWDPVSAWTPGWGGAMAVTETNALQAPAAFYRVRAQRP